MEFHKFLVTLPLFFLQMLSFEARYPLKFGDLIEPIFNQDFNYRLPNNTKPLKYMIELTTHVHNGSSPQQFEFSGKVSINFEVLEASNEITIHQRQLTIKKIELDDILASFNYDNQTEFLVIKSTSSLQVGSKHNLNIEYSGTLRTDNHGFYRTVSDDGTSKNRTSKYIAATQFESTDARHAFPCYDEPGIRAPIELIINHGTVYHALSNMPTKQVIIDSKTGYTKTHFVTTPSMQPYILAFFISDFKHVEDIENKQQVFAKPKLVEDGETNFALDAGIKILHELEKYLDVNYSLPKMDQVAVPDFAAGAMENWGLVMYREEYLLYNKNKSPMKQMASVAEIVGHEFGHQFFGNHVSPKWWSTLWLNEGFATFCEFLSADLAYPELQIGETFLNKKLYIAFSSDAKNNTRPMTTYVEDPKAIGSIFDDISYAKSGSFLRMLQHAMGNDVFRRGLKYYLEDKYLQSAVPEDLAAGLQRACDEFKCINDHKILDIINSWSLQKGYPVLTVNREDSGAVKLKQERFKIVEAENPIFIIPYSIATSKKPNFEITIPDGWLSTKEGILQPTANLNWTQNDWLIFNKQQTGYYRVNYDEDLWNLIIEQLKNDFEVVMHMNRAQLVEDSFTLATSSYIKYDIPLNLVGYIKDERKYVPWTVAQRNFYSMLLSMSGFDKYNLVKKFVCDLVEPLYNDLKIQNPPNETLHTKLLREIVVPLACKVGSKPCQIDSLTHLEGSIHNISHIIDPQLEILIFCNGLRTAGNETFLIIWDKMQKSLDLTEKFLLIDSLGCSESHNLLNWFLKSSIDEAASYQNNERSRVLSSVYNNYEYGLALSMDFLDQNREEIDRLYNAKGEKLAISRAVKGMAKYVANEKQLKTFEDLLLSLSNDKYITPDDIKTTDAIIEESFKWINDFGNDVDNWMKVNVKGAAEVIFPSGILIFVLFWIVHHLQ